MAPEASSGGRCARPGLGHGRGGWAERPTLQRAGLHLCHQPTAPHAAPGPLCLERPLSRAWRSPPHLLPAAGSPAVRQQYHMTRTGCGVPQPRGDHVTMPRGHEPRLWALWNVSEGAG